VIALYRKFQLNAKKEIENEFRITSKCGNGHFLCFLCGDEAHEPTKCEDWKKWKEEVAKSMAIITLKDGKTAVDVNQMATSIWLAQNTKKCPKCECSIQKNEGCNHMTCQKCRHEFCWICMEPWKKHGQQTGGYFSCNRYVGSGPNKAQEETKTAKEKERETERFVHFFERYGAHDMSRRLEEQKFSGVADRMSSLQKATSKKFSVDFIDAAFRELLKNRLLLRNSYIYRYYMDDGETELLEELRNDYDPEKSHVFETLQGEMETVTEALSGMVARNRMRNTKSDIIKAALAAREKRQAFLRSLFLETTEKELKKIEDGPYRRRSSAKPKIKIKEKKERRKEPRLKVRSHRHRRINSQPNASSSSSSMSSLSTSFFPTASTSFVPPPSTSFAFMTSSDNSNSEWECPQCTLINSASKEQCDACGHDTTIGTRRESQTFRLPPPPLVPPLQDRHSPESLDEDEDPVQRGRRSSDSSDNSEQLHNQQPRAMRFRIAPRRSSTPTTPLPSLLPPPPPIHDNDENENRLRDSISELGNAMDETNSEHDEWTCAFCTFTNAANEIACAVCANPKNSVPQSPISQGQQEQQEQPEELETELPTDVPLPIRDDSQVREVPGDGVQDEVMHEEIIPTNWACLTCTFHNSSEVGQCEMCGTAKP